MNSRIKKVEWVGIYAATGLLDLIQFLIDFTGVGEVINEIADPIIGVLLGGYFWFRKALTLHGTTSFFIAVIGKEGTLGAAPAWTIVVVYMNGQIVAEKKLAENPLLGQAVNIVKTATGEGGPLNSAGVRLPEKSIPPLNIGGVRKPPMIPSV